MLRLKERRKKTLKFLTKKSSKTRMETNRKSSFIFAPIMAYGAEAWYEEIMKKHNKKQLNAKHRTKKKKISRSNGMGNWRYGTPPTNSCASATSLDATLIRIHLFSIDFDANYETKTARKSVDIWFKISETYEFRLKKQREKQNKIYHCIIIRLLRGRRRY